VYSYVPPPASVDYGAELRLHDEVLHTLTNQAANTLAWCQSRYLPSGVWALIASQYADRPQLRPVLEAVLAALPAVGPATVQARKTFVSLPGPLTSRCRIARTEPLERRAGQVV
jgi:hypothetical protein